MKNEKIIKQKVEKIKDSIISLVEKHHNILSWKDDSDLYDAIAALNNILNRLNK